MSWANIGKGFVGSTVPTGLLYVIYLNTHTAHSSIHVEFEQGKTKVDSNNYFRGQEILKYGVPQSAAHVRYYANHALVYDQANKRPLWVAEHLTESALKGSANRKKSQFKRDPDVPFMFSAENSDYWKSGWSRGHMAPAGNNKQHQQAMDETFYLTNIVPQDLDNNSGFWNRFEMFSRDLTKTYSEVRIISGPLVLPNLSENGRTYVKYEVIGQKQVPVPTHLFKVILTENESEKVRNVGAFIVPNKPISSENELKQFQVPIEYLEEKSGLTFFHELDRSQTKNLCAATSCQLVSQGTMDLYFITRNVENARTVSDLHKAWSQLSEKRIKPDRQLLDAYERKRQDLTSKKSEL